MTNLASQANCILCRCSYQVIVSVSFSLIKAFTFSKLIFFPSFVDVLNLVLYPDRHSDQTNAGARHKALLSLKGFSGLQVLNKMDKHFNVIVIITTEEVIPLSFETIDQRADWLALLQGHFGKGEFKKKKEKYISRIASATGCHPKEKEIICIFITLGMPLDTKQKLCY